MFSVNGHGACFFLNNNGYGHTEIICTIENNMIIFVIYHLLDIEQRDMIYMHLAYTCIMLDPLTNICHEGKHIHM